jgi:excinuclease ABC subunit A
MAKLASPTVAEEATDHLFNEDSIQVIGAREHNLKDIDVAIPRDKLVVITGISGSGKSSLAFDTIYAEGQRRYMETFSAYARQFIGEMERPEVEQITGLSPVISIEQKTTGRNPRSTVGTVTEVYDFLRLLYARVGEAYSYETGRKMVSYTEEQIRDQIFNEFSERKISVLAPLVRGRKGHYRELFEQMRKQGYTKMRIDGEIQDLTPGLQVDRYKVHDIELVIDRLKVTEERRERLANSIQMASKMGGDLVMIADHEDNNKVVVFSKNLMDADSGLSYEEPSPNTFSFNSPYGYCPECKGLGVINQVDEDKVIPDDSKSINDAGIAPFGDVRDNMTFKQLRSIAKKFKFTFATPIKEIPEAAIKAILYGGNDSFNVRSQSSHDFSYNLAKEGIVNMLKRWYDNSTSEKIRRWAEDFMTISTCPSCHGQRLRKEALHFKLHQKNISDLAQMDLIALHTWVNNLPEHLSERQLMIAKDIIKEIRFRLDFLMQVGLDYLNLDRPARTLSGGEAQRIRLATQIGSQLTGITYILDEPSIGLHQRDNQRLIEALRELTDIGNTVIVVEHDRDIMLASDYLIDLGPGAGRLGGELVAQGLPQAIVDASETLTAKYLSRELDIELPAKRSKGSGQFLKLYGAAGNNLQSIDIKIPLGTFCCVTGVSGSGKSTLINETLYPILRQHFYKSLKPPMAYKKFEGLEHVDKVIEIDQSPIGRTPRSNPATYTGVFTDIRSLFSDLPEAKIRGYKPGRFSFNVKGGRCETCQGSGMRRIEMNFLPDVYVECETCLGRRYNRETLEILYKGKSISNVLEMSVTEAVQFFEPIPKIYRKLKTLNEVGLGYITLGQQATTLSGGEAQRVKLAEELSKRDTGNTVYILDEPTTGLHFEDIRYLLNVLTKLVAKGNTVIVIEHNLDVIKVADHIIDMGPEGGRRGGTLVVAGTPEQVAKCKESHTGHHLIMELADSKRMVE